MDYTKFCYHENHVSSLTKREIENPYLVLAELYKKRNVKDFQAELWNFYWVIFKEDEWIKYGADHLYRLQKDLVKLMDALSLINKYSPELSTLSPPEKRQAVPVQSFDLIFKGIDLKAGKESIPEPKDSPGTVLGHFYKKFSLGLTKVRFNNYLQVGLNASYMKGDKYEYFSFEDYNITFDFLHFNELIEEGYKLFEKGSRAFPLLESCEDTVFAIDSNLTTHLHEESIQDPSLPAENFYHDMININHVHHSMNIWENMLYKNGYWKKGSSPANMLHLHKWLIQLIEGMWLQITFGTLAISAKKYHDKSIYRDIAKNCTEEELKNPLLAVQGFFEFKEMHQWRKQLTDWLEYSLSNNEYPSENRTQTTQEFKYLLKFLEASYLLSHFKVKVK